jgi:hypothetical protein
MANSASRPKPTKKTTTSSQERYHKSLSPVDVPTSGNEQTSRSAAKSNKNHPQENRQSSSQLLASATERQTSHSTAKSKKNRPVVNSNGRQPSHSAAKSKTTSPPVIANLKPTVEELLKINLALEKKLQQYKGKSFKSFRWLISDYFTFVTQRSNMYDQPPISNVSLDPKVRQGVKRKVSIYLYRWEWLHGRMGKQSIIKCVCVFPLSCSSITPFLTTIQACVRRYSDKVGLNAADHYRRQEPEKLGQIFHMVGFFLSYNYLASVLKA